MARPKSHHTKLKTRRVVYRLTDAEFLRLSHKAAMANIKPNDFARMLTLAKVDPPSSKTHHQHDPVLVKQLHHIGHNLNQLVKNAHIFGRVSPQIEQLCQRIEALMNEAIEKDND